MQDDTFFDSQNAAYAQAMFEQYARNPDAVPDEWRQLFERGGDVAIPEGLLAPEQLTNAHARATAAQGLEAGSASSPSDTQKAFPIPTTPPKTTTRRIDDNAQALVSLLPAVSRATALVQAFRDHGHRLSRIDPLGTEPPGHPQLSPAFFGTSAEELSKLPASLILSDEHEDRSVADALKQLGEIYAGSIGYEFEHLDDHVKVDWLWEQVEAGIHLPELATEQRQSLLLRICETEGLEQFLHKTYLGQKRFSLEGNDTLVPMLDLVIEETARGGGSEVVLGMAHRGRLNVLTHTVGVPYGELLAEFEGPSFKGDNSTSAERVT